MNRRFGRLVDVLGVTLVQLFHRTGQGEDTGEQKEHYFFHCGALVSNELPLNTINMKTDGTTAQDFGWNTYEN